MSAFQERYLNDENRLRNAILFNEKVYNDVFHGVNNLYSQTKEEINENIKLIQHENNTFVIAEGINRLKIPTLFVFKFNKEEKINSEIVYKLIEQGDPKNYNYFVLSLKKREKPEEHINAKERVELLKNKMKDLNENSEKVIFTAEILKGNFLLSSNYLSKIYDFYNYLNESQNYDIDILSIFTVAEKDNLDYGNRIVEGLIDRVKIIKSVANNKYQEIYRHKIKIQNDLLLIKNEGSCFAIKQDDKDIIVYDINKKNTVGSVVKGESGKIPYSDTFMKTKNGKMVYFEKDFYDRIFRIVIQNLYLSLLQDKKIKEEPKIQQIMTYEYQKKLHCYLYHTNEAEFVASALLNRSGFNYNEEHKSLYESNYGYIDLKDFIVGEKEKICISYINNSTPLKNNMYLLSKEWKGGIEHLLAVLEDGNHSPTVHYGKTPEISINESIEYCRALLLLN